MNNDNFLIEQDYIESARQICRYIDDAEKRSIGAANVLASSIASKYFSEIEADTESGLHNIPCVFNDIEISDIYLNGNYVDVRIYFDENEIFIPKLHFDLDIIPVAYMFIKLEEDLSGGFVTGFIFPENVNKDESVNGYYKVDEADFVSFYDIESRLLSIDDEEIPDNFEKDVFAYLDGILSDKKSFFKLLTASKYARETLANASRVKNMLIGVKFDESEVLNNESNAVIEEISETEVSESLPEVTDTLNEVQEIGGLDEFPSENIDLLEEDDSMLEEVSLFDEAPADGLLTEENLTEIEDLGFEDDITPLDGFEQTTEADSPEDTSEEVLLSSDDLLSFDDTPELDIQQKYEDDEESGFENNSAEVLEIAPEQDDNSETEFVAENDGSETVDEFKELTELDYTTEVTPSIESIESAINNENDETDIIEDMLEESESVQENTENETEESENIQENTQNETEEPVNEQIENLFDNGYTAGIPVKKKKSSILPLLGVVAILSAAAYWGYTKFYLTTNVSETFDNNVNVNTPVKQEEIKKEEPAMPVETVENVETNKATNEGTANSIPVIEQNLDASIDVSNLSVNWEVPASYTTNATAKRYFVRVGKILQLNLKTELLLLSISPITNKISVELEFNKDTGKFSIKNLSESSGVPAIDKVIKETTEKTLGMNLNMNMSVFGNLQGNPVLVIKL